MGSEFGEWRFTIACTGYGLFAGFDTNSDRKLMAADANFALFKLMVTLPDGSQQVQTLAQAGITEIGLEDTLVSVTYADGSSVIGQSSFTRTNGTTCTVANMALAAEAPGTTMGHAVTKTSTTDASGTRTEMLTDKDTAGVLQTFVKTKAGLKNAAFELRVAA